MKAEFKNGGLRAITNTAGTNYGERPLLCVRAFLTAPPTVMRFSSVPNLVDPVRRMLRAVSTRLGIADVVDAFQQRIDRAAPSDGSSVTPSRRSSAGGPGTSVENPASTASARVGLNTNSEADVPASAFDASASAPPRGGLRPFAATTPGAEVDARSLFTSSDTARQPTHQHGADRGGRPGSTTGDARGVSPVLPEDASDGPVGRARIDDPGEARERARVAKLQILQRTGAARQVQANAATQNVLPLVGGE